MQILKLETNREQPDSVNGSKPAPPPSAVGDLTPNETAQRLIEWSAAKSALSLDRLIILGVMAGVFVAFGGAFFTGVMTELPLTHGPSRLLGGIAFSAGLLFVCVTGAELSMGNCMIVAAWATRRLTFKDVSRNLLISYIANVAGALLVALIIARSGLLDSGHGQVAAAVAESKMQLGYEQAFLRGILCNTLVCTGVWAILAGRTISSKLLGLLFPISAFITLGFENSIANIYLLPIGLLAGAQGSLATAALNIVFVTLGNLVGGAVVAVAFWMAHLRVDNKAHTTPVSARPFRLFNAKLQPSASRA